MHLKRKRVKRGGVRVVEEFLGQIDETYKYNKSQYLLIKFATL